MKQRWVISAFLFAAVAIILCALVQTATAFTVPEGFSLDCYIPAYPAVFPLERWSVSSGYGIREDPFTGATAFHQGVDLAAGEGSQIYAAADGVVTKAEYSDSYGNYIHIAHANGVETQYCHMQYLFARAGQSVQAGEVIGTVGQTGRATGPHLHFELFYNCIRYDPAEWLGIA